MHLVLDGRLEQIINRATLEDIIARLVLEIRMTPIAPLSIVTAFDGLTLVQIVGESHIVVHTVQDFVHIDIFSCRPFDAEKAKSFCLEAFKITSICNYQVLPRGFGNNITLQSVPT